MTAQTFIIAGYDEQHVIGFEFVIPNAKLREALMTANVSRALLPWGNKLITKISWQEVKTIAGIVGLVPRDHNYQWYLELSPD